MKTVSQIVDALGKLFVSRNIEFLEYDFSRETEGKKVAFFNMLAFVSLEDVRHIANVVAPDEDNYPDFTGAIENWNSTAEPMFLNWRTVTYIGLLPIKINYVSW